MGGPSHSIAIEPTLAPTSSPSHRQSGHPSSGKPLVGPSHSNEPTPRMSPAHSPLVSLPTIPRDAPLPVPNVSPSQYPTRHGDDVGPIQTNGIRIALFGIDTIHSETEWNAGMARYIEQYFNSKRNDVYDVS